MKKTALFFVLALICSGSFSFPQEITRIFSVKDSTYHSDSDIRQRTSRADKEETKIQIENLPKYAPGEVIIKYKLSSASKIAAGTEILSEHERLKALVEKSVNKKINFHKPVYNSIVSEMIEKNISEQQVKQDFIKNITAKKNTNLKFADDFLKYEFSKAIVISFNDYNIDPAELSKIISTDAIFSAAGFIIDYAEPNYLFYTSYNFNDPYYNYQWAHKKTQAAEAWNIEAGNPNIKIGIIDTGIDYTHEDLVQNYISSISSDFVDIDTISYINSDYSTMAGEDYTTPDSDPKDFNGHGTHCAGIAAARGNNGIGVIGVAPNCSIVSLRAGFSILRYGTEYGALENDDIANAILYAITNNINILSMSFGGSEAAMTVNNALSKAYYRGIVLIAAAGNTSMDDIQYPAGYSNVISVAATNSSDQRAYFSTYGSWVDIAAPGESIYSTVPKTGGANCIASGYKYLSGTSMATPYVAGLAALILSKNPDFNPQNVEYVIKKSADTPAELSTYIGIGRINVFKALQIDNPKTDNLYVEISKPANGEVILGVTEFVGVAQGTEYKLSFGKGLYPSTWTVIDSGMSGSYGSLGTLDVSSMPVGRYTVKLETWNQTDEAFITSFAIVSRKENYHQGFPLNIYSKMHVTPVSFNLADVDNNGKKDIITVNGTILTSRNYSAISIYNSEGQMLQGWPQDLPFHSIADSDPLVADIDADGRDEILILGFDWDDNNDFITVYNYKGETLPGWPRKIRGLTSEFSVSDINLDGKAEIVCGCSEKLYVLRYDGSNLPGWPIDLPKDYFPRSQIVLSNLDSDPELEIATTVFSNLDPNNNPNYTYAVNIDGSLVAGYPYAQDFWGWCLAGGDINTDGRIEIITQEGPLSATGLKLPWAHTNMHSYSSFAIGNVNSDNFLEVLYGDGNGRAYLNNYRGQSLPGWPKREGEFTADGKNIIADIAGDDTPEIIIPWVSNTVASSGMRPGIYAYYVNGDIVEGFPKLVDQYLIGKVAVDDIDNDGLTELLCLDSDTQTLIMFDLDKPYKSENTQWPIYQNNPWNTGAYPNHKNNVLPDYTPFSINEDDSLNIQLSPYYLEWNDYIVNIQAENTNTTSFNNGIFKFKPAANWSGTENITASVQGPQGSDATVFRINTIPVNDVPYLNSSLPHPVINEDAGESVVINRLENYFKDNDISDKLTYTISAGIGIDSVKVIQKEFWEAKSKSASESQESQKDSYTANSAKNSDGISGITIAHELSVFPSQNFNGNVKIFIKAADDSLASVSDTLILKINPVNDTPVISAITDQIIQEDDSLEIILSASDIEKDILSFYVNDSSNKLFFNITDSLLTIKPEKNWNGEDSIIVTVSDGKDSTSVHFNLSVVPVNDAPLITSSLPDAVLSEDDSSAVILQNITSFFNDPENDKISFSARTLSEGIDSLVILNKQLDSTSSKSKSATVKRIKKNYKQLSREQGIVSTNDRVIIKNNKTTINNFFIISSRQIADLIAYPTLNFYGEVKIELSACDDSLAATKDTFTVIINPVNDKPVLAVIEDQQIYEDTKLTIPIVVSDAENDHLFFSLKSSNDSLSMLIRNDSIVVTPLNDWFGNSVITVYAADLTDNDSIQFNLNVLPVNDKPGDFSLIAPADKYLLNIADSSASDSTLFNWSKAVNTDKEKMLYSLYISDSLHSVVIPSISDTMVYISRSEFINWVDNNTSSCKWYVKVYDIQDSVNSINGPFTIFITDNITGIDGINLPKEYALFQNYPNPFNPSTNIKFNVPSRALVSLKVYNILGEEVATLINEELDAGSYTVVFSSSITSSLASGTYIYSLKAGDFRQVMKMVLLK